MTATTIPSDLLKLVSDHDDAVRRMGEAKPSHRQKLLSQLEHVERAEKGLPVFWFAPRGSKERGHVDHWVRVASGDPLVCSCGDLLYPGPQPEGYVLEDIVAHFAAVAS